jgi:sarcosine oxidase gamma subunit
MPSSNPPIAQSPLTAMHRRHGACVDARDGWLVATKYADEPSSSGNALIDLAHRPTGELAGPEVGQRLAELCGADVPLRGIHAGEDWQAYRLTPGRAILFGKIPTAPNGAPNVPILDVTGGWVSLALIGRDAERLLNKVTAVDLRERTIPVGGCCQGPIFGVNTLFGRFVDHFELHICGDSAEFLWEVLMDAGEEFGLKPAGADYAKLRLVV